MGQEKRCEVSARSSEKKPHRRVRLISRLNSCQSLHDIFREKWPAPELEEPNSTLFHLSSMFVGMMFPSVVLTKCSLSLTLMTLKAPSFNKLSISLKRGASNFLLFSLVNSKRLCFVIKHHHAIVRLECTWSRFGQGIITPVYDCLR